MDDSERDYPSICVVTNPIGAADIAVQDLLAILSEITDVSVITANMPDDSPVREKHEVVNITDERDLDNILFASVLFLLNQLKMCREIRRRDEEVILFYGAIAYTLPVVFARIVGKTVVLEPRANVPLDLRIRWEKSLPSPVARFLAGSVGLLETISYTVSDAIITYTPNMADELGLRRYDDKLYDEGARFMDTEEFQPFVPYEERENRVGFLGRLEPNKRIKELAEAAQLLPDKITFVFVGDGSMRDWLGEELEDEIQDGTVEMSGWIDHEEVPYELSKLKLIVLPSEPTEGLPTVILEALACGTPVYATPVSGILDVVRDGETGFLMEDTPPESIAAEIERVHDEENLGEISEKARSLAVEKYSFKAAVERYRGILSQL